MRDFAARKTFIRIKITLARLAAVCIAAGAFTQAQAQNQTPRCENWAARLVALEGQAQWRTGTAAQWQPAGNGTVFCVGDTLRIRDSRATVRLPNDTVVRLQENTTLKFLPPRPAFWVELLRGVAHFITRTPQPFEVKTPYFNAAIKGTEFTVAAAAAGDTIAVFEGQVEVGNPLGQLSLQPGEAAAVQANGAPRKTTTVKLRDTVAWALYFPPLPVPESAPEAVKQAIAAGRLREASENLAALAAPQQSAELLSLAAALALYRGQVDESARLLDRALQRQPREPTALALQSIRQMAAGDGAGALDLARANTAAAPDSAAAWLALSYVQQSLFQLEEAAASTRQALQHAPNSGLLWARQAELALMSGDYKKADRHAQRAATLSPNLSRTHTVAGFSALNRSRLAAALEAFQRAAGLDAADPLPQLGLGLIAIRQGRLSAGRERLENAVALDPGTAVIRSYLGKAYYEERRNTLADTQYALAQQLDPADPTPWFYRALRKQSDNQLLEALDDLDSAIARNDNRAVYRSRLLLDNDSAARAASQARIYNALRFDQLAVLNGAAAVEQAPGEYSGHRLLAEVYTDRPYQETLRASNNLMATLLAPVGTQPPTLGLRETGLLVVDGAGPMDMGVNEYNPLFTREGLSGRLSVLGGTQDTNAYDWNLNGFWRNTSISIGQYRYKTDGFRDNNDVEYEIANLLVQHQATPDLGLQLELRRREEETGDIELRFDLDDFSENLRLDERVDTARLGLNYRLSPNSRLLGSVIRSKTDADREDQSELFPGFIVDLSTRFENETDHAEIQYQLTTGNSNWTVGATHTKLEAELVNVSGFPPPQFFDTDFQGLYAYSIWPLLDDTLTVTAGLTYDDYRSDVVGDLRGPSTVSEEEIYPQFGVEWQVSSALTLRASALRSLSAPGSQLSIEPTHVAGFAQVYDDPPGSTSDPLGAAVDYRPTDNIAAGLEYIERDLTVRLANNREQDLDNEILNGHLYYKVNRFMALAANYRYEKFERNANFATPNPSLPLLLNTRQLPLTMTVMTGSDITFSLTANLVRQKLATEPQVAILPGIEETEDFWTLDSSISLKLPKRLGLLTLEFRNLLDKDFRYRDFNFFTAEPRPQKLITERAVFLKADLRF